MPDQDVAPDVAQGVTEPAESDVVPVAIVAPKRGRTRDPELKDRCKVLYFQGLTHSAIAEITGVAPNLLRAWASRHGWAKAASTAKEVIAAKGQRVLSIHTPPPSASSNAARETLSKVLERAANKLAGKATLADIAEIRKLGEALEPLVRSGKILHNWGNDAPGGVVIAEVLGHERQSPAITVQAEQVPCGPDTPTGSVPQASTDAPAPQLTQPSVDQPSPQAPN